MLVSTLHFNYHVTHSHALHSQDCWAVMQRNATTQRIIPDPTKFPNGIDGLAAQIHALGLKVGIYRSEPSSWTLFFFVAIHTIIFSDAGTATCSGFPGSLGYENIDAATFNEWGIDCEHRVLVTSSAIHMLKFNQQISNTVINWLLS